MRTPTTRLSTAIFNDLSPQTGARVWAEALREAGLLDDVPPSPGEAWSPAGALKAIQASLGELRIAEAALVEAQEADPLKNLPIPDAVWGLVMLALLGVILFANALVAWLGPAAVWGGLAFAGAVALFTVVDRRRRGAEQAAQQRRDAAADALWAHVEDLVTRNGVALVGERVLVSTPDLDQLRALEAALALSDPDAELLGRIRDQLAAAEAALEGLLAHPTAAWRAAGLEIDVDRYEREVDAL